ncbi:MAG: conjugal transfer protein TraX [Lachnospiraceae bacterium]|nr:conjugal transfer protein TraX [Lachnospiraceae bacterium]
MKKNFSGLTLKIIAIVSMLIDHIGAAVIEPILSAPNNLSNSQFQTLLHIDYICRDIGRLAFPLFCFLIVEGFLHTRNWKKYLLRLCIFALISEIPFDLAFQRKLIELNAQNVFFTLAIGLLTIAITKMIREKFWYYNSNFTINITNLILYFTSVMSVLVVAMATSILLHTDYNAPGVVAIFIIYTFYPRSREIALLIAVLFLTVTIDQSEMFAIFDIIFIYFYNGSKGKQIKYFFYLFYPIHLTILAGIATSLIGKV